MLGKKFDITVPTGGAVDVTLGLNTDQVVSSWLFVGYVYDPATPATAKVSLTIALDPTEKTIRATLEADAVVALLSSNETSAQLAYRILCRPNTTTGRQFFFGDFAITEGGPAWA